MTKSDDIPDDVRNFILTKIDSVPQLEALLLVWEHSSDVWTEASLARELYINASTAKSISAELLRRGWIKPTSPEKGFSFDPSWDPSGEFMTRLKDAYRKKLVLIATLIHSNASAAVRQFASAFDLKRK